jgi:hypothetical protein
MVSVPVSGSRSSRRGRDGGTYAAAGAFRVDAEALKRGDEIGLGERSSLANDADGEQGEHGGAGEDRGAGLVRDLRGLRVARLLDKPLGGHQRADDSCDPDELTAAGNSDRNSHAP